MDVLEYHHHRTIVVKGFQNHPWECYNTMYGSTAVKMQQLLKCWSVKMLFRVVSFCSVETRKMFYTEKSVYSSFPEVRGKWQSVLAIWEWPKVTLSSGKCRHARLTCRFFWTNQFPAQYRLMNIFNTFVVGLGLLNWQNEASRWPKSPKFWKFLKFQIMFYEC